MKKFLSVFFIATCILSMSTMGTVSAARNVTMYAADGRTISVPSGEVNDYKKVGWFVQPPVLMYAEDGRTLYVDRDEIAIYENLGWSLKKTMYAADGTTRQVSGDAIASYKAAGWFMQKPVQMYAADGRTCFVAVEEVAAYQAVGWFTQPPVLMYAADGRTLIVSGDEIELYKSVGWFTQPPVLMYAADGRTLDVSGDEVELYLSLGWYKEPMCYMYSAGGQQIVVPKAQAESYRNAGWYTSYADAAYQKVIYAIDGMVNTGDYAGAVTRCEAAMSDFGESSPYYSDFESKKRDVMDVWRNAVKQPVVVEYTYVDSYYGTKCANLVLRNISYKTVVGMEAEWYCYDIFGNPVKYYGYSSNTHKFEAYTDQREDLRPGEQEEWWWKMYGYDRADSVKYVKITKIAFSDGTIWKR